MLWTHSCLWVVQMPRKGIRTTARPPRAHYEQTRRRDASCSMHILHRRGASSISRRCPLHSNISTVPMLRIPPDNTTRAFVHWFELCLHSCIEEQVHDRSVYSNTQLHAQLPSLGLCASSVIEYLAKQSYWSIFASIT